MRVPTFRMLCLGLLGAMIATPGVSVGAAAGAPQVMLGPGWGPVETFGGATFRWEGEDAEIVVRGRGIASVSIDAEAGPGIGRTTFVLRAIDASGRQSDAARVSGRSKVELFLPAEADGASYRLHVDDVNARPAKMGRVLDYRVFSISSAGGELLYPEIATPPVQIAGGWYPLETYHGEVFRWVDDDARFRIATRSARNATLRFIVEPGPSLGSAPLSLTVLQNGRRLRTLRLQRRTTVSFPVTLSAGNTEFALTSRSGTVRVPNDPRKLDFRILSLQLI